MYLFIILHTINKMCFDIIYELKNEVSDYYTLENYKEPLENYKELLENYKELLENYKEPLVNTIIPLP